MKQVRIVTDSTADVPAALASELKIGIIPCLIYFGEKAYRDGVDLSPEAYYPKLSTAQELPRTSQPAMSDFVETYRRILEEEQEIKIVSIHVAGSMSGTVNAAWASAQELPDPSRVEVIDSGLVSLGIGWVVIKAAQMAQAGGTQAKIVKTVRDLLDRSKTAAMIDNLEGLYKGGRISQISALLGTALQIKPLLSIQGGEVLVWGKVRTRSKALRQLVAYVREWGPLAELAVVHVDAEELAQSLADSLQDLVPAERMIVAPAGAAVSTHLGIGTVGVCGLQAANGE